MDSFIEKDYNDLMIEVTFWIRYSNDFDQKLKNALFYILLSFTLNRLTIVISFNGITFNYNIDWLHPKEGLD